MPRLKHCPVCGNFPQIDYDRSFTASAKVYCIHCGRQTDWYDAFWSSDASHRARIAWNTDEVANEGNGKLAK